MKLPLKSANILTIFALFFPLLLSGCADTPWPSWLTGEPDASVLESPRVVGTPSSQYDLSYPNLATVPSKPKDFSNKAERQKIISVMEKNKTEAQEIKEKLEAMPGVGDEPLAMPLSSANEPQDTP